MHAVVITVRFKDLAAAKAGLKNGLVAQVADMQGFVGGYWVELSSERGVSIAIFDNEANAQALADFVRNTPGDAPVATESIEVGAVVGHA